MGPEYEVVTFDCYGTLVDWETGIRTAFRQSLEGTALSKVQESRVFGLYEREERRIEGERPFRPYQQVLSLAAEAVARKLGTTVQEEISRVLVEQLPTWNPFPDTNPALEKLARKYKLGILSNVDDDLLAGTMKHFTVPFDLVVTAERVRSYKPGTKHFEEARRIIGGDTGWLHVAASLYHDIEPASKLSIRSVWVNRQNSRAGKQLAGTMVKEVRNLTELTDWLKL
jgi:2-haloalkanoic acid dehalogenase type II